MKQLTLLLLLLTFSQGLIQAQSNRDSTEYLIERLINIVNELPRTNVSGQSDVKFQSQYSLDWEIKSKTLTLIDKRYSPNSDKKLHDEFIIEFDIQSMHNNGVFIRSLQQDKNISFQIFTANNDKKIKSLHYINGECVVGMYHDRLTIGSWDTLVVYKQLDTIRELLIKTIQLNTDWDEKATPDLKKTVIPEIIKQPGFKYSLISYEQNDESPIFLNSTIEKPALFLDSKSGMENTEIINNYIIEQIYKKGIKMKGNLSGNIIISKLGDVEDFKSFNMNKRKVEREVKKIILSMPKWKAGEQEGVYVRTSQTILIKK